MIKNIVWGLIGALLGGILGLLAHIVDPDTLPYPEFPILMAIVTGVCIFVLFSLHEEWGVVGRNARKYPTDRL